MNKRTINRYILVAITLGSAGMLIASDQHMHNSNTISMFMRCQKDLISVRLTSAQTSISKTLDITPTHSSVLLPGQNPIISEGDRFISNKFIFDFFEKQCAGKSELSIDNVQKDLYIPAYRTYLAAHHKIKCPQQNCAWYLYEG